MLFAIAAANHPIPVFVDLVSLRVSATRKTQSQLKNDWHHWSLVSESMPPQQSLSMVKLPPMVCAKRSAC